MLGILQTSNEIFNGKLSHFGTILLGLVFVLSGVTKCINIYSFAQEVREYLVLYFNDFLGNHSLFLAIVVCTIEITIGFWGLMREYGIVFSVMSFGLMSFFTILAGINYLFPSIIGSVESCGCFGELIHFTPLTSFLKSAFLLVASTLLLTCNFRLFTVPYLKFVLQNPYSYICFAVSMILPLYSTIAFKELEHTTYIWIGSFLCIAIVFTIMVAAHHYTKR